MSRHSFFRSLESRIQTSLKWVRDWRWARQRALDLEVLWPICKERARSLEEARLIFLYHAVADPAWARYYGAGLPDEINRLE